MVSFISGNPLLRQQKGSMKGFDVERDCREGGFER
jgi:hypothetical protein